MILVILLIENFAGRSVDVLSGVVIFPWVAKGSAHKYADTDVQKLLLAAAIYCAAELVHALLRARDSGQYTTSGPYAVVCICLYFSSRSTWISILSHRGAIRR